MLSYNKRTAHLIADIANSLDESIQVTIDIPEINSNRRLPVLDLTIGIENNEIVHSFYKKKMSSPFIIL